MIEIETKKTTCKGVAALTLGIISIISALFWYISLPTGILGIVFGIKANKQTGSKLGKAGLITGIVGLSLFAFIYITFIIVILCNNLH